MEQFGDYAYYYNSFYKDKDYASEARDVNSLLIKYGKDIQDIIIFGCGTGSHDAELSHMGYQCHGIDISSTMIDEARKNSEALNLGVTYEVADIREYNSDKKYDAVISLFHVMSYQTSNDDIKKAFSSARAALSPGGLLVFDAWYGPGVLTDPPAVRIKEVEDGTNRLIRLCRPEIDDVTNTVDVNYEILVINNNDSSTKTINETHHMRYFFCPEVKEYLKQAGFEMLEVLDCNTLGKTSFDSWTSYFVAVAE